ncbi:RNA-directed RNA polymerase 2 [Vararia minispora EC-137]|uniref:RNA-directed RNA polymerase 2 n=1 Tax=Vararia minispora EC-137 TaxID=1314806 RepID=A0ACB8QNV9_9AGAM|nr:RNA-directed RNA polymerase 2 [Vararia minispora EC-137]
MEIFMRNIPYACTQHRLDRALADVLHNAPFQDMSLHQINFQIFLFQDKRKLHVHSGTGSLTLPTLEIGQRFLDEYGGPLPSRSLSVDNRKILFHLSNRPPNPNIVRMVFERPYKDPAIREEMERRQELLKQGNVPLDTIQFGWECRDSVFSIEWESCFSSLVVPSLSFIDDKREVCIRIQDLSIPSLDQHRDVFIVVRYSHISYLFELSPYKSNPSDFGSMAAEVFGMFQDKELPRTRLSFLPLERHDIAVPYTSLALRLVLPSADALAQFRDLCAGAQLRSIASEQYPIDRRNLFSASAIDQLYAWERELPWTVAFQVESIVRALDVDVREMLALLPRIADMAVQHHAAYTAAFLRVFRNRVRAWWSSDADDDGVRRDETVEDCFVQAEKEHRREYTKLSSESIDANLFQCLHVTVTPTTMQLDGPFPERSNRVIRTYPSQHHESFLRVSFVEEDGMRYSFDPGLDARQFVKKRFGTILKEGLEVAGRKFTFLAYSMSALKEHTAWFMKSFDLEERPRCFIHISAQSIIASLGIFDDKTRRCPARYAARISQAVSATDQSAVKVARLTDIPDIWTEDGVYCFTDGVGKISLELAEKIWAEQQAQRKRARKSREPHPRAFQIRLQGAKGMLAVDYRLQGSVIAIRESMTKFTVQESSAVTIEIAQAFHNPMPYFLNRPLIMLLEGLGVRYEVFKRYQDAAIAEIKSSKASLLGVASLLERYGLGTSFHLPSLFNSLAKLGIHHLHGDPFWERILDSAVNHILRDLKNHARIPVPESWVLVGVCDEHGVLEEGEIYACVALSDGEKYYFEGPVLISRSPTVALGDVQIAKAIGRPQEGSPFDVEPLPNTVIFSVKGQRPLPSCLGGGDLDGDTYNLIPLNKCPDFRPRRIEPPASYPQPKRRELVHGYSTMNDVADFVVEYINSDVLGIIASNWLIIADQSTVEPHGVYDEDCQRLAQLHSLAVDYQKSGNPVPLQDIPRLKFREKPDWSAPETVDVEQSGRYYESNRALGRLFRDIDLGEVWPKLNRPRHSRKIELDDLADMLGASMFSERDRGLIEARIMEFDIRKAPPTAEEIKIVSRLYHRYVDELHGICATHVLTHRPGRSAMLTEEEAVVGTIIEKTSQPRKRKDLMSKLREKADFIVRDVRNELFAATDEEPEEALRRAWVAWKVALKMDGVFGAKSFGWIALGSVFEAVKGIEDAEKRSRGTKLGRTA